MKQEAFERAEEDRMVREAQEAIRKSNMEEPEQQSRPISQPNLEE